MAIDWTKIWEAHKGKWVALLDDEVTVIASGTTAEDAYRQAILNGCNNPILSRMPTELVTYVGATV